MRSLCSLCSRFQSTLLLLVVTLVLASSQTAISQSVVRFLPGFPGPLPFELETGYVGVDDGGDEVQLFYYFIKSERNPREDPLVLWLTGGPGCSAFSGLIFEIGPLNFVVAKYNGSLPSLKLHAESWTKVSNIIFVDAPVRTGFSYVAGSHPYEGGDFKQSTHLYIFLKKWLNDHTEFLSNPVYIAGDSYSGFIVPLVALHVSDGNEAESEPLINLKGYIVGNPATVPHVENNKKIPFAHGMALISDELYRSSKKNCRGDYVRINPNNKKCLSDVEAINKCLVGINKAQILEKRCPLVSPKPFGMLGSRRYLRGNFQELLDPQPPLPKFGCRSYAYLLSYYWMNDERVREALHIRKGTVKMWRRCNRGMSYKKEIKSSFPYHVELSKRGYRSLVYSGDHDMLVPFLGTEWWVRALNYSTVDEWRQWRVEGQVAGYTMAFSNRMTFATVKGAGHTAPEYKPKQCLAMYKRWLSQQPV